MATNFPTSLDTFTNPTPTSYTNQASVPHAAQHANVNDAVEALQTKVGINGSTDATSLDKKIVGLTARIPTFEVANGVTDSVNKVFTVTGVILGDPLVLSPVGTPLAVHLVTGSTITLVTAPSTSPMVFYVSA